jgi:long-chain acyl-CoA synthetase
MKSKPWLATYRDNDIPAEIDANAYPSVVHLLDAAMTKFADKPAFRSFGQTLSYADVDRLSSAFAAWLQHKLGVKRGDRIAVMVPNVLAFPIAFLGIARAGGVQVNVNPLYTPRELEHQLNDSGSAIIVIFNGSTPTLAEIVGKTGIKTVITVSPGGGSGAALPAPPVDARLKGSIAFADVLTEGATLRRTPVELNGDDLLFLQYTGGTTGLSKGACLSHRNLVANTEQFKAVMPAAVRPGQEVIVTAIPLYHIFAFFITHKNQLQSLSRFCVIRCALVYTDERFPHLSLKFMFRRTKGTKQTWQIFQGLTKLSFCCQDGYHQHENTTSD